MERVHALENLRKMDQILQKSTLAVIILETVALNPKP